SAGPRAGPPGGRGEIAQHRDRGTQRPERAARAAIDRYPGPSPLPTIDWNFVNAGALRKASPAACPGGRSAARNTERRGVTRAEGGWDRNGLLPRRTQVEELSSGGSRGDGHYLRRHR